MNPQVIGLPPAVPRVADRAPSESSEQTWEFPAIAAICSRLLGRDVSLDQLTEKGLALGLWEHLPSAPAGMRIGPQAASRLLIAGYRLPAQAGSVTLSMLRSHLAGGLNVILLLPEPLTTTSLALNENQLFPFRVQASPAGREQDSFILQGLQETPGLSHHLSLEQLAQRFNAGGIPAVIGAGSWDDLPIQGSTFFGGSRDPDGSYHWDIAEYNTDRCGRILHC
jgi:hypothetical protein